MNVFIVIVMFLPNLHCAPVASSDSVLELLHGTHDDQVHGAQIFLEKYGYPTGSSLTEENDIREEDLAEALKEFQEMETIPVTGKVDETTTNRMEIPRCGNHDVDRSRTKRFSVTRYFWEIKNITYKIVSRPANFRGDLNKTISQAFGMWSDVTPLTFTEVQTKADIKLKFRYIDGRSGTLAQAALPTGGEIQFDIYEQWTVNNYTGTNLLQVATHEIGHAIGIDHSKNSDAVMHAYYPGYERNFKLRLDDIQAAQTLYGKSNTAKNSAGGCSDASIDAITMTSDRSTYAFKGIWYYEITPNEFNFNFENPKPLKDWANIEGPIDAALTLTSHMTILFKGKSYWVFNNTNYVGGPFDIVPTDKGLTDNVDAAVLYHRTNMAYIFKDDVYWRLKNDAEVQEDESSASIDDGYPKNIDIWGFSGVKIDAALRWHNGRNYFFSGEYYYRYSDYKLKFDEGYPKKISTVWFDCGDS